MHSELQHYNDPILCSKKLMNQQTLQAKSSLQSTPFLESRGLWQEES